jgi:hypothetical protein
MTALKTAVAPFRFTPHHSRRVNADSGPDEEDRMNSPAFESPREPFTRHATHTPPMVAVLIKLGGGRIACPVPLLAAVAICKNTS